MEASEETKETKEKYTQEEEEKLQLAIEKNYFLNSLVPETLKSFSQFPPSIYRRSLACTIIQHAWRRFQGRKLRLRIKIEQNKAATIIQRMVRMKLKRIRAIKNTAARIIQRNWRWKKYFHLALLRCKYQQPIPELHLMARIIQRAYRRWYLYRNSPIAFKYKKRIEDIIAACRKIQRWWRPLLKKVMQEKVVQMRHKAATDIQRVYRGHALRKMLRPDLRAKLWDIGISVAKHRKTLLRIRAAYCIQGIWRSYIYRKVRAMKVRTRNQAAARMQAFWKGYWVRTHIHLRFNYGQAVYLSAVCRGLRQCRFILKSYKPCGIVCPK